MAMIWLPRLGVWFCFFVGNAFILFGLIVFAVWPIGFMNYYDCWGPEGCPDHLIIAKMGPVVSQSLIITFFQCFAGPAGMVILSKAVGQEEQASVQAGLQLVQQLSGMWSNLAYTAWFFNVNAKRWAVVHYVFFTFGANCVAYGIGCATYWWCVYRPEMANAAKDQMYLFPVESSANPRRRVGAVRSVADSVNYRQWTSADYRRRNPGAYRPNAADYRRAGDVSEE